MRTEIRTADPAANRDIFFISPPRFAQLEIKREAIMDARPLSTRYFDSRQIKLKVPTRVGFGGFVRFCFRLALALVFVRGRKKCGAEKAGRGKACERKSGPCISPPPGFTFLQIALRRTQRANFGITRNRRLCDPFVMARNLEGAKFRLAKP